MCRRVIKGDQANNLRASLLVQLLKGDLTHNLVAEVTPGPDRGR